MKRIRNSIRIFLHRHEKQTLFLKNKNTVFFAMLFISLITAAIVLGSVKTLAVSFDGITKTYKTTSNDLLGYLRSKGIEWNWHDTIDISNERSNYKVEIKRAFPITLICDDTSTTEWVTSGCVADILAEHEITLSDTDYLNFDQSEPLCADMKIKVTRVSENTVTEYEDIPFTSKTIDVYFAARNKAPKDVAGVNGTLEVVSRKIYVDGVLAKTEVISKKIIKKPVDAIHYNVITPPKKLVNGKELSYTRMLNMQATSYTVTNGIYMTATGAKAQVGCVAINPKVCTDLKLGDKLYIETADGKWIYGYATVCDVGLMPTPDLIDVYLPSLTDCYSWGRRNVKVYVLSD